MKKNDLKECADKDDLTQKIVDAFARLEPADRATVLQLAEKMATHSKEGVL